jgi:hypothetical protein
MLTCFCDYTRFQKDITYLDTLDIITSHFYKREGQLLS